MTNVSLQNWAHDLVRKYEEGRKVRLDREQLASEFGPRGGDVIERLLRGEPAADRSSLLEAVELLGGDDKDASSGLLLSTRAWPSAPRTDQEAIVLNDRLMTRLENLERYLRRIGKVEDFRRWVESGAPE